MKSLSKLLSLSVSLLFGASMLFAQGTITPSRSPEASKTKTTASKSSKRKATAPSETALLRQALDTQQQQIQQLREELAKRDATLQQIQQQLSTLQATTAQAQSTAQAAAGSSQENATRIGRFQNALLDLSEGEIAQSASAPQSEKRAEDLEHPMALHYKGITITPGGFAALYGIYRQRNTGSDAISSFSNFPFSGTSQANLSEFRLTGRHSNLNVMAQGSVKGLKTTAYFEMDFEGAANSNEVLTTSFNPRIREFWAHVEGKSGWSVLGGQTWTLITANRKSIAPKAEFRPATIDGSYLVGYHYARLATLRVADKVSDKFAVAFSVENPEAVIQGNGATVANVVGGVQGSGFSAAPAPDMAPDLAAKIALDGWGHYELGGIVRFFRNRTAGTVLGVPNSGSSSTNEGGGLVVNASLPLVPKKADFFVNALAGRGIGRYGPGGGVDAIVKPDGSLMPVKGAILLAGFETHPTANLDLLLYGGNEYYGRTVYGAGTTASPFVGYGVTTADLRACSVERPVANTACNAVNRDIWEITPVLWHRFWKGREGTLQWGLQYEYIHRRAWRGNAGSAGAPQPVGIENVIFTGLRWYFP